MLKRIGIESTVSDNYKVIENAEKLILPGVGSYDFGMTQLNNSGLIDLLNKKVIIEKKPVLGICLGAQLLTEGSEEGKLAGLGWIKGRTVSFDKNKLGANQKIPHMGWTEVFDYQKSKLFSDMYDDARFYFVHSYHLKIEEKK